MIRLLKKRRIYKIVKHLVREAKHAKNMRKDVSSEKELTDIDMAIAEILLMYKEFDHKDPHFDDKFEKAVTDVATAIEALYPKRKHLKLRENIEILVVAIAVAMAFRAYFIQPFKIPTGSMQPTLYGITYSSATNKAASDRFPMNIFKLALFGEKYVEIKSRITGKVSRQYRHNTKGMIIIYIDNIPHEIHPGMTHHFEFGGNVSKGQVLASGIKRVGDHIFVDKLRYNFVRPKRGDISVFDTGNIKHPAIKSKTFYIKRLAGIPNENISINPPYLLVDGQEVTEPYAFFRQANNKTEGYEGYTIPKTASLIKTPKDVIVLKDDEYLPLGDNTKHSLDGRYFGAINEKDLIGPAFSVYWPLGKRCWNRLQ